MSQAGYTSFDLTRKDIGRFWGEDEYGEIAGRGHAQIKGITYHLKCNKISGWNKFVLATITLIGIVLIVASIFFFSAFKGTGISKKIISYLNNFFTKLQLQIFGFTTVSLGALLFIGAIGTYCYLSRKSNTNYMRNFPFNGEHQLPSPNLPPIFSPGNWIVCNGVQSTIELQELPAKYFVLGTKTDVRGGWDRCYYFIVNTGTHYTLSSGMNEQEAILMAQELQNKYSYAFFRNSINRQDPVHMALYKNEMPIKAENSLNIVPTVQKIVRININGEEVPESFEKVVTEGTYLLSRSWKDISHPHYERDIGFVSITLKKDGCWYSRLIFKEEGETLEASIKKVESQLQASGIMPAKTEVFTFPGWSGGDSIKKLNEAYGKTHHFGRRA